jgi:hypothetical protein
MKTAAIFIQAQFEFKINHKNWNVFFVKQAKGYEVNIFYGGNYRYTYNTTLRVCPKNAEEFLNKYLEID